MTEIESEVSYFGFIAAEFVQWELTSKGHLMVTTLDETHIYIGKDKWQYKRSFFGPGSIEFKIAHCGSVFVFKLRMNPVRERDANQQMFYSGRNGVFNLPARPFSSRFGRGKVIDPDNTLNTS
jgi:hypothetical protein